MNTHSNPDVERLVERIDDAYSNERIEEFNVLNEQLRDYARENGDELAHLMYRYNDLNNEFDASRFDVCEKGNLELIPLFTKHKAYYYVLRCYNTLGIIESERAHYYECLGYYIIALQLSEKNPQFCFSAILANNIGNLFVWLNEYEHALPYLLKAYDFYDSEKLDMPRAKAVILVNIIECYGCLQRYEDSNTWYKKPYAFTENELCVIDNLIICNQIEQACEQQDYTTLEPMCDRLMENIAAYDEYIYHFRSLLRALRVCIEANNREYCKRLMELMDVLNKGEEISSFSYDYAELKMKYYYTYRDMQDENFTVYSDEYYTQSSIAFKMLRKTYAQSMILRLDLEKVKDERQDVIDKNVLLEKDLELDPFTKIYNKEGIKKNCIKKMKDAKDCAKHALFVLDIDYFKKVNDTYGHKAGDEVLLNVVKLLKSVANEHLLVGRFGGDEFILFYTDYEDVLKITQLATSLVERAKKIIIPESDNEAITFSIGIQTYQGNKDFEAMFFKADKALYDCKHEGRNGYRIQEEMK